MWSLHSISKAWYSGDIGTLFECCFSEREEYDAALDADPSLERTVAIEIDKLFARFDRDASGKVDKQELGAMVKDLRARGYALANRDDKVVQQILQEFESGEHDDLVDVEEFRLWFRAVVITQPANLRTLFFASAWVQAVIKRMFDQADADKSGRVSVKELRAALKGIFKALGDPTPHGDAVVEARVKMMSYDGNGDMQLSFSEFRHAVVEIMSGLFYAHFKADFEDPCAERNIRAAKRGFQNDRDFSHQQENTFDKEHHDVVTLHEKIKKERMSMLRAPAARGG
jgi:Ca2+-binding EF-hand superfamily protein